MARPFKRTLCNKSKDSERSINKRFPYHFEISVSKGEANDKVHWRSLQPKYNGWDRKEPNFPAETLKWLST